MRGCLLGIVGLAVGVGGCGDAPSEVRAGPAVVAPDEISSELTCDLTEEQLLAGKWCSAESCEMPPEEEGGGEGAQEWPAAEEEEPPGEEEADCCGDASDPCAWWSDGTCDEGCAWGDDVDCAPAEEEGEGGWEGDDEYAACCGDASDPCGWAEDEVCDECAFFDPACEEWSTAQPGRHEYALEDASSVCGFNPSLTPPPRLGECWTDEFVQRRYAVQYGVIASAIDCVVDVFQVPFSCIMDDFDNGAGRTIADACGAAFPRDAWRRMACAAHCIDGYYRRNEGGALSSPCRERARAFVEVVQSMSPIPRSEVGYRGFSGKWSDGTRAGHVVNRITVCGLEGGSCVAYIQDVGWDPGVFYPLTQSTCARQAMPAVR